MAPFCENIAAMRVTREAWIEAHPYLEPVARFQAALAELVGSLPLPDPPPLRWEEYAPEFEAGVPLLRSEAAGQALLRAAAPSLPALVELASEAPLAEPFATATRDIRAQLRRAPPDGLAALEWVSGHAPRWPAPQPGALRFLAWTALAHALAPTIAGYAAWRADGGWERGTCPTCGASPTLSHLASGPGNAGRRRTLLCACCGTRWAARRIGCPHCGSDDCGSLGILEVEREAGLRVEVCLACRGYVKTCVDDDPGAFLLADWATLHLDALAVEHGYRRAGDSLYEL